MKTIYLSLCAVSVTLAAAEPIKPNIVYILADDMGPGDVRAYNKDCKFPTPHLDQLAQEGMMFHDAHTNSSVCTPTRYGILTGRYAWRTRLKSSVLGGHSGHLIDPNRTTVASFLKGSGYATACIGKWHLGMDWVNLGDKRMKPSGGLDVDISKPIKNGPNDVGFDYFFGISASLNMDPHAYILNRNIQGDLVLLKDAKAVKNHGLVKAKPGYAAKDFRQNKVLETFTKKTCQWIEQQKDSPFFVYMSLNSPHSPIVPNENFRGKSGLSPHGDFCMETDWAVGQVMDTLKRLKIANNTLVIFTADNGTSPAAKFEPMQSKGHFPSFIYRGLKGTTWEGGHRMPFIVMWPNEIKPNTHCREVICTTDFLATIAELNGKDLKDNEGEDSVSFYPFLKQNAVKGSSSSRMIIHHSDSGKFAVRKGKWKLILDDFGGSRRKNPKDKPVINKAAKLLFNLDTDIGETTNLSTQHPEKVKELLQELLLIIENGRSTPGEKQLNSKLAAPKYWPAFEELKKSVKDER